MSFKPTKLNTAILSVMAGIATTATVQAEEVLIELDAVEVSDTAISDSIGTYQPVPTSSSTGLTLEAQKTPQAMTVITRQQLDDFSIKNMNEALDLTTGVSVERIETDRTYYTARGFEITNFQYDGLGVPSFSGNQLGDVDTAIFDRVEVVRGANGLMSASGQPSATVNLIRKKPTNDFQASLNASAGSWNNYRVEADVSNTLNEDGSIRGRVVGVFGDKESYIDRYGKQNQVFYGVLEFDLTDTTLLTVGHHTQVQKADSPFWGGLTFDASSDFDVSDSTAADWSYWDNTTHNTFAEVEQQFNNGWAFTGRATYQQLEGDSDLLYVYESSGLRAYSSRYENETDQWIVDGKLAGPFSLAGREHEAILGYQWFRSEVWEYSGYGPTYDPISLDTALAGSYAKPAMDLSTNGSDWNYTQRSLYGAARFSLTDQLSLLAGARAIDYEIQGTGYGVSRDASLDWKMVPYSGMTYDITPDITLYGSYTEIFDPQDEVGTDLKLLDPVEGKNYEVGVKTKVAEGRALASVALFRTEQDNVAEQVGTAGAIRLYEAVDGITSTGVELELSGELLPGLQVQTGYTYVKIEDADGERAITHAPSHAFKLAGTYSLASIEGMKVGGSLRWQDDIYNADNEFTRQDSYTVVNLMSSYDFSDHLTGSVNLNNITDEKYLNSVKVAQAHYGAPRNLMFNLSYNY